MTFPAWQAALRPRTRVAGTSSAVALIAVAAVLPAIGVGSPILFRQQRLGLLGWPFILIKFRTVTCWVAPRHSKESGGRSFGSSL